MHSEYCDSPLRIGNWSVDPVSGEISGESGVQRLEPKVMELLLLLASRPGDLFSREQIMAALWPEVIVGEDSLARVLSKLRAALGDDARHPTYVETLARRGYRLLVPVVQASVAAGTRPTDDAHPAVSPASAPHSSARGSRLAWMAVLAALVLAIWRFSPEPETIDGGGGQVGDTLIARADDAYFQYSRAENEAAIELYQRVLGLDGDNPLALSGLANALVQRSVRWPHTTDPEPPTFTRLGDALENGHLDREPALSQLRRAQQLAERALALAPESAIAYKAVGFVASAQRRFDPALAAYHAAIELDPDAWGPMINIADVLEIQGRPDAALPWFERAFDAMERSYSSEPARVRPWQARLGILIAQRHRDKGEGTLAELWYRRVLSFSPLDAEATVGLAQTLRDGGDSEQARRLCEELDRRLGKNGHCD